MAVAPYPHIKMGVRDESIATILEEEIMPLDKPLYMVRAKQGPVGVPIWCATYQIACQRFGKDTFNKRSKYWSEASYFLLKTLTMNGAFIMRVADENVTASKVYLQIGVQTGVDVPQWQRNPVTGAFVLADDGSRVKINKDGNPCEPLTEIQGTFTPTTDTVITAGTDYYYRDYNSYIYKPCKLTVATENMVVFYGDGAPTIDKIYKASEITEELRASNFVFEISNGDPSSPELVYLADSAQPDASKFYATIKFNSYLSKLVAAGEPIYDSADGDDPDTENDGVGKYYTRTPDYSDGYTYKPVSVGTGSGDMVRVGDVIYDNNDILRETTQDVYHSTEDTEPDENKTYYLEENGEYILAENNGHPTEFEAGADYLEKSSSTSNVFVTNLGTLYVAGEILQPGDMEPQANIENGVRLLWRAAPETAEYEENGPDWAGPYGPSQYDGKRVDWYPVITFIAKNPGVWGQDFGFRFFYDKQQNTVAGIAGNGAVKYTIGPVELREGDTTPVGITNAYGESVVNGTARLNVVDPTTELNIDLKTLIPANYSGSRELPMTIYWIPENFEKVGRIVMNAELEAKDQIKHLYPELLTTTYNDDGSVADTTYETFVETLLKSLSIDGAEEDPAAALARLDNAGYMANVVSCVDGSRVPYFASEVVGNYNEAKDEVVGLDYICDMNSDSAFYLRDGDDGDINDWDIEKYQRYQIDCAVAQTQEYLIDYLRCPFNNIIDTGVSLATKKSYLDFMGVRDNLTVFLTPQQIWKQKNAITGEAEFPPELTRYEDESVGAVLRSYGLLMREDIENSTEANRAIIFLASGINNDHDWNPGNLVASTLWVALKNAQYLSGQRITQEPIERPHSEITCYDKGLTWTAASEETRSRCWNAGLNYAQYFDQNGIHYASCRSIYKYDTSVLCDMGTVRAVTFCKDIIRKEWAIWAGSKRKADDLNERITKALTNKLATMLNQKYDFSVNVYQTDEDKKYGFVRHVDLTLTSPATNRVWLSTIIVRREGFDPNAQD